jgi:hypothetical protein
METKMRAAMRCVAEANLTYDVALEEEMKREQQFLSASSARGGREPALKKPCLEVPDTSEGESSTNVTTSTLQHKNGDVAADDKGAIKHGSAQDCTRDLDFLKSFDWDNDLKEWEGQRNIVLNPIRAIFGNMTNCNNVTINFNGNVTFRK